MIRHFLQSRRARLSPQDAGIVPVGRRGTPGLRREEVAILAGVSVSWYTWLEQGRDIKVSTHVLDAVSSALRLNSPERAHLYRLTGAQPPLTDDMPCAPRLPQLARVVDNWPRTPAYITDRHWNTVAANTRARTALGIPADGHNLLSAFFTDPRSPERFPQWTELARRMAGQFRAQAARYPKDPRFDRMTRELALTSPAFRQWWERHEVHDHSPTVLEIRVPDGGTETYDQVTLAISGSPELKLSLLMPAEQPLEARPPGTAGPVRTATGPAQTGYASAVA